MNWKTIEGYEGFYEVSDCGSVRSLDRKVQRGRAEGGFNVVKGRTLCTPLVAGYPHVVLCDSNAKKTSMYVHRLVAMHHVANPDALPVVNHKNGIKTDARAENLEWVSADDNKAHSWRVLGHGNKVGHNPRKSKVVSREMPAIDYTNEQWRAVPGWDNYEVSDCGRVRSKDHFRKCNKASGYVQKGRMVKSVATGPNNHDLRVSLTQGPWRQNNSVHRLVARAWIPNPDNKPEVNHINGNSHDNRLTNLEWSTRLENQRHSREVLGQCLGQNCNLSKLTEENVREIRRMIEDDVNLNLIAEKFSVNLNSIYDIWKGKTWAHLK